MPPASLRRTASNSPRHAPIPKDSRAARAARRERVVLAEIELWRSVAGQTSTPSRTPSEGSFVDENGSVAGSVGTEDDADEAPEPVEDDAPQRSEAPSPSRRRRPLRPAQQPTSTRTLRPLASRTLSFAGFPVPTVAPEIRSLELDVSHLAIVDAPVRPPSTPRRRSTRLRL